MESRYIKIQGKEIVLSGLVKFVILPHVIDDLIEKCPLNPATVLSDISAQGNILVTTVKGRGETNYLLHTRFGVFSFCEESHQSTLDDFGKISNVESDCFLVRGFREKSLMDVNQALIHGLRFYSTDGIVYLVRSSKHEMFNAFFRGQVYDSIRYNNESGRRCVRLIKEHCRQERERNYNKPEIQEEELNPHLVALLDQAEKYSLLSNELELQKAETMGKFSYSSFTSVEYPKLDRIAYQFSIAKQDNQVLKQGVIVEVLDSSEEKNFPAEIVDVKKDGTKENITLLFTKEMDLRSIPNQGWIRLSVSNVNMDVQTAAIENIRSGNAQAEYFNAVLGENKPQGFDKEDFTELEKELRSEKYPPNDSQINAIERGIQTKDIYLVMGPPGTGKTTVILQWVKYFVKKKHWRVLVSSQNNKAVDNVLERFMDEPGVDTIRIGSEAKVSKNLHPLLFEKKISALRESISHSTENSISELRSAIEIWAKYLDCLNQYKEQLEVLYTKHEAADQYANKYIQPIKKQMYQQMKESAHLVGLLNQEKVNSARHIRLNEKYKRAKLFWRILFFAPIIYIRHKISASQKWVAVQCNLQNQIAKAYNENHKRLEQNYQYFDDSVLKPYYATYEHVYDATSQLIENPPKPLPDLGLFSSCQLPAEDLNNSSSILALSERIRSELEKARTLLDDISSWKEDIGSTQNYALNQMLLDSVDLVGATCIGVSSQKRFQDLDFDVAIIDEAGQIQIHNAIVPMSVAKKVIMLGDHMQIPPMADSDLIALCEQNDVETDLLNMSLFEKLYTSLPKANKTILDTQYRMPAEIADVLSSWFYGGKYKSPDFKRDMQPSMPSISDKNLVLVDTFSEEGGQLEVRNPDGGYSNPAEASLIKQIVKHILDSSEYSEKNIGVISAYKLQVHLIQKELKGIVNPESIGSMVASLDSFQGQEREIIIYSFTRSSVKRAEKARIGFLSELRRLNVAMSRCKKLLIMVGDFKYLSTCEKSDAKNIIYSEDGSQIVKGSEAVFSDFIRVMINNVQRGNGEMIDMQSFLSRIGGA